MSAGELLTVQYTLIVYSIVSYVAGAYILRGMAKTIQSGKKSGKKLDNADYSGLTLSWMFSPIWFWMWAVTSGADSFFKGLGRWISGE
jgi:hypothetical protein